MFEKKPPVLIILQACPTLSQRMDHKFGSYYFVAPKQNTTLERYIKHHPVLYSSPFLPYPYSSPKNAYLLEKTAISFASFGFSPYFCIAIRNNKGCNLNNEGA